MEAEIRNAVIESTSLGYEDHGIFTAILHLDYGGAGQGFGLYALDAYDKENDCRKGTAYGMEFIIRTMRVVGVKNWEELEGKHIRAKANWNKVVAIGHFLEDNWFNPDEDLKDFIDEDNND